MADYDSDPLVVLLRQEEEDGEADAWISFEMSGGAVTRPEYREE